MYKPEPVDTAEIEIPEDVQAVLEVVSKNIHEVWAKQKTDEGWVYAPETDEKKKTHRCLTDYEKLSEQDKQYDRNTVAQTVKTLLKMGYKITKN